MLKTNRFLKEFIFFNTFLGILLFTAPQTTFAQEEGYSQYGATFIVQEEVMGDSNTYAKLGTSEKKETQLKGTVTDVCQAKGCWMKVDLDKENEVFVRFKDYGFFVPTDAAGKKIVINGLAFVEEMSVEDQRHYAQDKGASEDEIKKITQPKRTLRFEADGVRILD